MSKMPKDHGGKRKGAGRKPKGEPVEKLCLALRPEVLKQLDALCIQWDCGRSAAVTKMIQFVNHSKE